MLSFSQVAEALTGLIYHRPLGENFSSETDDGLCMQARSERPRCWGKKASYACALILTIGVLNMPKWLETRKVRDSGGLYQATPMMAKESHSGPLRVKITRHKNQKEYYKAPSKGSKGKTIRPNWLHGKFTHLSNTYPIHVGTSS